MSSLLARAAAVFLFAAFLSVRLAPAQTKLHLPSQSSTADFSQFSLTRPVKLSTVLSPSCLTGELLFKTDNPTGNNLYVCSNSSWFALNTVSVTGLNGLTDLQVSAGGAVVSVGTGKFRYLDSTGRYAVSELSAASLTRLAGSDNGTLRVEVDDAGGTPVLRCLYGSGMTPSNYSASGCATVSQSFFTVGAQPLASVTIAGGVWGTPVDLRALGGSANYSAGAGLIKTGNVFSLNTAIIPLLATANNWIAKQTMTPSGADAGLNVGSSAGDPSSPGNGDVWYNSTSGKFRCRQGGVSVDCIPTQAPAGTDTQLQFHDGGAFGGDAGLTWNKTLKALVVARNGSGALITAQATNTAAVNDVATLQSCLNNDSNNCAGLRHSYTNFDGAGNAYWAGLIKRSGSNTYPIIVQPDGGGIHLGGSGSSDPLGTGPGWLTVTAGGVSRFANAPTAGLGLAPVLGVWSSTGLTGDVPAQTLLAAAHTAGSYRVCGTVSVTTAATGNFTPWTLSWRDPSSGSDLSKNIAFDDDAAISSTPSKAAASAFSAVCKTIQSTGASAVQVNAGDAAEALYNAYFSIERLQ